MTRAAGRFVLHQGDALRILAEHSDREFDAIITDPPYSSGGMVRADRMAGTSDDGKLWCDFPTRWPTSCAVMPRNGYAVTRAAMASTCTDAAITGTSATGGPYSAAKRKDSA